MVEGGLENGLDMIIRDAIIDGGSVSTWRHDALEAESTELMG